MSFLRKVTPVVALATLIACGGNGSVSNPAHLRFFDALSDVTTNARVYVGGHLYAAGGKTSFNDGDGGAYGDVPSSTSETMVVNDYSDQNSAVHTGSLASLSSQTLTQGLYYTAVALVTGTTKEIVLYSDNSTLTSANAYFRVIDAYAATTPLYIEVRQGSATGTLVYASSTTDGLADGGTTGVQYIPTTATGGVGYTITVYSDSGFTNPIGSTAVSLTAGLSVTTLLYANTSGTGLQFKSSTDAETAPTSTTTTTATTSTTGTATTGTATTGTATTGTATTTAGTTATTSTTGTHRPRPPERRSAKMAKIRNLGFACVLADGSLSTNHTFRLANLSPARLAETAHQNLDDLERILTTMSEGPLRLFRLGGSTIPLASHESLDFDWKPLVAGRLRAIGETFGARGFRFSTHPGQYTILNATDDGIVRRALGELNYACDLLDLMGLDASHKVVIHGGGIYGDREAATARLAEALRTLPPKVCRRVVLENDERLFSLAQILDVAERGGVPVVFDLHHHQINPGEGDLHEMLMRVRETWGDGFPKIHMSSQKPGARVGAHDDLLHEADLATMLQAIPFDTDVMVESKGKEVAAMHAYDWLRAHDGLTKP